PAQRTPSPQHPTRSPRGQRVRFKSSAGFQQNPPRSLSTEDERTEAEKTQRNQQPHRPSTPFEHGSTDIADIPLSQRTTEAEEPQQKESMGKKAEHEIEDEAEET